MNNQIVLLVLAILNFSQIANSKPSLPAACDPAIKFYLWTKANLNKVEIDMDDTYSEAGNTFVPGGKTVFFNHGFQSGCSAVLPIRPGLIYTVQGIAEAFLASNKGNYDNFICVDGGSLLGFGNSIYYYLTAAYNTKLVGECGANMAYYLTQKASGYKLKRKNIFVVGHSLGAHTSGSMGRYFKKIAKGKIPYITGIEPAGPGFYTNILPIPIPGFPLLPVIYPELALTKNDAKYVQGIHTNAHGFGTATRVGHADFYVEYFKTLQPYCKTGLLPGSGSCNYGPPSRPLFCSHEIAGIYFIESLDKNAPGFNGCRFKLDKPNPGSKICLNDEKYLMGGTYTDKKRPTGTFYVEVNTCPVGGYFSKG